MRHGRFPPEGAGTAAAHAAQAMEAITTGAILEGQAIKCTDTHDLLVDMGGCRGRIPKQEAALGVAEGETRDIAIISRVGKPVCFTVTHCEEDGEYRLSRRAAQSRARAWHMENTQVGDVITGRVTHLENFGVFVDIGCGTVSFIGIENISVSRIFHPRQRFALGQDIYAAVLEKDPALGRITLTHRELLGTWQENAAAFSPGVTVPGVIRGVEDYGMFVELTPNLSGLAERREGFKAGDRVSVYIKSIQPQRMKIKLAVVEHLPALPAKLIGPSDYWVNQGPLGHWQYSPPGCDKVIDRRFATA